MSLSLLLALLLCAPSQAAAPLPSRSWRAAGRPALAAPALDENARSRLSVREGSDLLRRIGKALRAEGVGRFDVVGGSAASLLKAADTRRLAFRDLDIAVVAGEPVDEERAAALARAIAREFGARFDGSGVQDREREREADGRAERYTAGYGAFIDTEYGLVDLSVFHGPEDLARNGLLSWDRIRVPVEKGFRLAPFLKDVRRKGAERLAAEGRVADPHGGWADLRAGTPRLVNEAALRTAPHLAAMRVLNQLDKRGLGLPAELETLLRKQFPARAPPRLGWTVFNLNKTASRPSSAAPFLKKLSELGFFRGWADPLGKFLETASAAAIRGLVSNPSIQSYPSFRALGALVEASTPPPARAWFSQGVLDFSPESYSKVHPLPAAPPGIVASLGPASSDPGTIGRLADAGAAWVRVNLAHNGDEESRAFAQAIGEARRGRPALPVLFDLPGGKIRTGPEPEGGALELKEGAPFLLRYGVPEERSTVQGATVDYADLSEAAKPGGAVLLHQGKIELKITGTSPGRVETVVARGGVLRGHATVDLPGADPPFPLLREEDRLKLAIAARHGADYVGASMVQRPEQMDALRAELARLGAPGVKLVSKIETLSALANIDGIVARSDAVMIAGGDLATAVGSPEALRAAELLIADAAARHGKPLIAATGYEGPDAPSRVARAARLGARFILLKGTSIRADGEAVVARLRSIIEGLRAG